MRVSSDGSIHIEKYKEEYSIMISLFYHLTNRIPIVRKMTLADRTSSSVDDNHVFPPAWLRVQNDILGNKLLCPFRGHRQPHNNTETMLHKVRKMFSSGNRHLVFHNNGWIAIDYFGNWIPLIYKEKLALVKGLLCSPNFLYQQGLGCIFSETSNRSV